MIAALDWPLPQSATDVSTDRYLGRPTVDTTGFVYSAAPARRPSRKNLTWLFAASHRTRNLIWSPRFAAPSARDARMLSASGVRRTSVALTVRPAAEAAELPTSTIATTSP